ncbi:MAG: carbon-nitrogen hydrolase family protein [Solirubrobacteraceae bacterium]
MIDQSIDSTGEGALRAAAIQLNATEDTDRNLEAADRLTREAADRGARLVVLPEKWSVLGTEEQLRAGAEPLDGPGVTWAREAALQLGIDLVAGSIVESTADGRHHNTSVHVGRDGELHAVYRKIHLFDVEVDATVYRESDLEDPGEEVVTTAVDGVGVGMTVCYDLRFPELYRILALRGAKILLVPSAFTLPTTRDHWEVLLRARAIEDQAFVIAPNQIGASGAGARSGGRSMIVDPWGVVLAQAPDAECVIVAELDIARVDEVRERLPSLANRRPGAYAWPERERMHA